ncbi:hypothetical protein QTH97_21865 [Variovorax sp. J22R24]|uniref:hypothetical protein n=1 Tax=Variovorax gracilis TaxID=3053502 RepID=UPI0025760A6E|nr:hypothetical protein [Variovorax sp. J22R24]MDM0107610.1 hypothetical protein [Variovorax sp. J22R24]
MPAPTEWQPAPHPTLAGFYCLRRFPHADQPPEHFGNRLGGEPSIEAFATREQAERVSRYAKGRRGCIVDERDIDYA